jgi:hypothetical protein
MLVSAVPAYWTRSRVSLSGPLGAIKIESEPGRPRYVSPNFDRYCSTIATGQSTAVLVEQMQITLYLATGVAIVIASFGLTLSLLDHGVTATVTEIVRYIDP